MVTNVSNRIVEYFSVYLSKMWKVELDDVSNQYLKFMVGNQNYLFPVFLIKQESN